MENSIILPILLQIAGVVVIIAEIILPSGGMLAVLAAGLFGYSIFVVFKTVSIAAGVILTTADAMLIPIAVIIGIKFLSKSPATLHTELSRERGVTSQDLDLDGYVGCQGTVLTALRPAGTARVEGRRIDVVSRGEFIDKGVEIVVVEVTGNQIIVREKEI